jgi:hypothetical protein
MPDITIDPDAIESARVSMLVVRDTLNGQYAQHQSVTGQIEGILREAASPVFAALDPFSIWNRLGIGGVSNSCSSIRDALEQARSTTDQVVERLCDTHRGQLAPIIHDRAGPLHEALSSAIDSQWTITSLLDPGNIVRMIGNHGFILEHFSHSRSMLYRACTQVQVFIDFLTRLQAREASLIAEITRTLTVTSPSLGGALQGVPISIQGNQPATPTYPLTTDEAASHLANALDAEGGIYNVLDLDKLRKDPYLAPHEKEIVTLLTQMEGSHPIYGADKKTVIGYGNVQCVALVAISLMLSGVPGFGLDNGTNGVRITHLAGDAGNAENWYPNLKGVHGWSHSDGNSHLGTGASQWEPRKGDLIVWQIKDAKGNVLEGHIAVVTDVQGTKVSYAQANSSPPTGTLTISADGTVHDNTYPIKDVDGHYIKDKDGHNVTHTTTLEGFLRYDGH